MYKVFVNNKPIIFTTLLKNEEVFPLYTFKNSNIQDVINKLQTDKLKGVYLFSLNLENDWKSFCLDFKVVVAGGGLVRNEKDELLFIFRGGRWDFPKGHLEKNENIEDTAIREVEEECGVSNLQIEKFLLKTYHLFSKNKSYNIKETHWYLMCTDYLGELTPQTEEGITEAVFKNTQETAIALQNTYANIQLVYDAFLSKK